MFLKIFSLVLLNVIVLTYAQVPIPTRPLGFVYNNASYSSPIHLDAFFDLACPDSKMAFPVMKQLADSYGSATLRLKFLIFPLPYHRNAHFAAKATQAAFSAPMSGHTADASAIAWMQTAFAYQIKWSDSATSNMNYDQIQTLIASYSTSLGYNAADFKNMMMSSDMDQNARVEWKLGCTKGVAGTPWYFINGVQVSADGSWTVDEWKKLIDPLLKGRSLYSNV